MGSACVRGTKVYSGHVSPRKVSSRFSRNVLRDTAEINTAVCANDVQNVETLIGYKCPMDATTCRLAAERGYHDILMFLHQHGCVWDGSTVTCALKAGHTDVAKWAYKNG